MFIPPLLLLGLFSLPYGLIHRAFAQRRWLKLLSEMRSRGRVVDFREIEGEANCGGGTLIIEFERRLPKTPIRCWWTSEDIYAQYPYPLGSSIDPYDKNPPFDEAARWCRARYTDNQKGTASLVLADHPLDRLTAPPDCLRWVDIPFNSSLKKLGVPGAVPPTRK